MSNLENARLIKSKSPTWTPSLFDAGIMDVDSPRYNSEQDYAIESQYPHIQSPDFAPNAPLTSALDMPLSSMTFASSITKNTPSIFASLSHSPFYRDLQAPTDSVQQFTDAVAFSPFDAIMRTPGDFSISPPAFQDVITPLGKNFELSDDWMISGSYISPVIHATPSRKKPTTRLACSPPMSFMDRLQSHSSPAGVISPRHARTSTRSSSPLLSPCKLIPPFRPSVKKENDPHQQLRLQYHATNDSLSPMSPSVSRRPLSKFNDLSVRATEHRPTPRCPANTLPISPLTPLTPSPTKSIPPSAENKPRKRRLSMSESPTMRVKRMRYTSRRIDSLHDDASPAPILPRKKITPTPVFGMRTLPSAPFAVSPDFPLFYRRFPIPSYLRVGKFGSPCMLFGMPHPGGVYNAPRDPFDLYTPRFVKGRGAEKVGLCPICIEAPMRGGEGKKVWLSMKFSAFKCYHMQYHHGISASTGRPLSPPIDFRVVARPSPKKKERAEVQQGKCHKCMRWIAVETVMDVDVKVKELYWWKHAVACHNGSLLDGEGDVFEEDRVYEVLNESSCGTC